ncbi:hypothetical protein JCM8097_004441 [Rhodosporidiobolus ruineniae]
MSTATSSSFHFPSSTTAASSPPTSSASPASGSPNLPPPVGAPSSSPPSADATRFSPHLDGGASSTSHSTTSTSTASDVPTPLFERPPSSSSSSTRPLPPTRSVSYKTDTDIWGTSPTDTSRGLGNGSDNAFQRTARAASDGLILTSSFGGALGGGGEGRAAGGTRLSSLGSDESSEEQAFFREHQRRSLEHSASQRLTSSKGFLASPPLASATTATGSSLAANRGATSPFFQPPSFLSTTSSVGGATSPGMTNSLALPSLLSPTTQSPPSTAPFSPPLSASNGEIGPPGSKGATLHLGDLDVWMDEAYVRECCALMGWDSVVNVKMSRGASPSSGYCFLTFPSATEASRVLARFNAGPPMLMPRSGRTFKLNWGTGLPGLQPRWDGEYSVFVGDLAREVGESELMGLFTPLFPSTKSAKVMCDPSTGLSRGYGFVRFGEESDMQRALVLGSNTTNSGLTLKGRTIRISEASGPTVGGGGGPPSALDGMGHLRERTRTRSSEGSQGPPSQGQYASPPHLQQQQQGYFPPYPPHPPPPHLADGQFDGHVPYASPPLPGTPGSGPYGPFSPSPHGAPGPGMYGPPVPTPGGGFMSPPPQMGPPPHHPSHHQHGPPHPHHHQQQQQRGPGGGPPNGGPLSPGLVGLDGGLGGGPTPRAPVRQPIPAGSVPTGGDPNNTTVFVGGLPACISEETLKSFFHHFGEITYCKIPAGKGCGFVQFVRRADAELAIAKMNDFPIHGKSRIRLSWGRSQGDKQVEHVRKLASALGVPFDAVWRMVQGQDNSTIKQIASAVGNNSNNGQNGTGAAQAAAQAATSPSQQPAQQPSPSGGRSQMDLRAVANAAGLTESEVLDLVKSGANGLGGLGAASNGNGSGASSSNGGSGFSSLGNGGGGSAANGLNGGSTTASTSPADSRDSSSSSGGGGTGGPYSAVSPTSFSSASYSRPSHSNGQLPLSPPPSAPAGAGSFAAHQMQQSPYHSIPSDAYQLQHPAQSPYERVSFADGGRAGFQAGGGGGGGKYAAEQPHDVGGAQGHYTHYGAPGGNGLENGFASLSLGTQQQQPRSLPPPHLHAFSPEAAVNSAPFFPTNTAAQAQQAGGDGGWGAGWTA